MTNVYRHPYLSQTAIIHCIINTAVRKNRETWMMVMVQNVITEFAKQENCETEVVKTIRVGNRGILKQGWW